MAACSSKFSFYCCVTSNVGFPNTTRKCSEFKRDWRSEAPEQVITYQQGVDGEGVSSFLYMSDPVKHNGTEAAGYQAWENQACWCG